jgi:hypothetical protein
MRYLLAGLDLIGFTGLCTSAVLVASLFSFVQLTLRYLLKLKEKTSKTFRRLHSTEMLSMTRTVKNGSNWIVIRFWKFSFLVGVKGEDK